MSKSTSTRVGILIGLVACLAGGGCFGGEAAVNIGSRLELFVDDYLIDRMDGVSLLLHHPVPREEVIRFDAPWEGDTSAYVTVFKDGDRYRMYYRGSSGKNEHPELTCTAESADGITWTKPKLGIYECMGTNENNIVWMSAGVHALVPFKDANPDAKPGEAYKAVGPFSGANVKNALYAYASPDGYHWKQLGDGPIITEGAFDSQNLAFWDAKRKEYVCYFRDFGNGIRDVKRSTSKDFLHWTKPEWLIWTGAPPEHLYTNAIAPYSRAPHIYLGFPKRFVPERKAIESHPITGVSDAVFISSRDGLNFHRWPEAFIRPGPDPNNWTDRNVMPAWGLLELTPEEISIYYSQHYRHPTSHMVRGTLRTDGFVSVHAGAKGGEMVTKPLIFQGRELVLNYSTSAIGSVRVELGDGEGKPVPGFTLDDCPAIYGDEIERVVKWSAGTGVSSLAGKPVRLRFELKDADLYSIRFRGME